MKSSPIPVRIQSLPSPPYTVSSSWAPLTKLLPAPRCTTSSPRSPRTETSKSPDRAEVSTVSSPRRGQISRSIGSCSVNRAWRLQVAPTPSGTSSGWHFFGGSHFQDCVPVSTNCSRPPLTVTVRFEFCCPARNRYPFLVLLMIAELLRG